MGWLGSMIVEWGPPEQGVPGHIGESAVVCRARMLGMLIRCWAVRWEIARMRRSPSHLMTH